MIGTASVSVHDGLDIMNDWWVRNVPVTGVDESFVGNLSFWTVMRPSPSERPPPDGR